MSAARKPRTLAGLGLGALAVASGLGLAGCEDDTTYAYFKVNVVIADPAPADFLARIAVCGANVEGADSDFAALSCTPGSVGKNMGAFEWSTVEKSGSVRFIVVIKDVAMMELGRGMAEANIAPDRVTETTLTVTPNPAALIPR